MFYPLYQMQQHLSQSEHNDRNICTTYVHHGTNSGLEVNKNRPPQCRGEGTRPGQVLGQGTLLSQCHSSTSRLGNHFGSRILITGSVESSISSSSCGWLLFQNDSIFLSNSFSSFQLLVSKYHIIIGCNGNFSWCS